MIHENDKVKVIGEWGDMWTSCGQKNEWIVDHIKTPIAQNGLTFYVCKPINGTTLYQFQKHEIVQI